MDVTAPAWPFNLCKACFSLLDFISQTFTVLLTEPAAINLDLGENIQQFIDDGSY